MATWLSPVLPVHRCIPDGTSDKRFIVLLSDMWRVLLLICICHLCFKHSFLLFFFSFSVNAPTFCECLCMFCEHCKMPIFSSYSTPPKGRLIHSKFLLLCITVLLLCVCVSLFVILIFFSDGLIYKRSIQVQLMGINHNRWQLREHSERIFPSPFKCILQGSL